MAEYWSNLAMVTSVVVYLLALGAFAAEWAAARKLEPEVVPAGVLVASGGEEVIGDAPAPEVAAPTSKAPDDTATRIRVDMFGRMGLALTLIGWASHLAGVVMRGVAGNRFPWGNMYEFVTAAMLFIVTIFLVLAFRGVRWLGLPVTLLAVIGQGLAVTVFYVAVAPLVPALHSVWFVIHIVAAAVAGAAFNVGGLLSILYLLKSRAVRREKVRGYLAKLPSPTRIDELAYRFHAFAFPLWTFAIAAGSVWAEYAWGRFWGWDPKETWSLVTWVVYAGYLHARATAGWRGRRAAVVAIVGLACFWFNFVGINLLVSGLHSYAGI
ncbi:c-type cytochrome biogenesis protein CcsB [Micropruina sp. KQZ13P-5]|nr:c-type cytochrome biogenesis protein CcsB [Micropruina sp. KQZ13P-5]MCW3156642.1 c-type cytochrome biogenesis protein CcsB [Micropruina sp. KQZ13P-5]